MHVNLAYTATHVATDLVAHLSSMGAHIKEYAISGQKCLDYLLAWGLLL